MDVPRIGHTFGHYRVVRHLGRGGMGEVFEAEDTILKRRVALKFLPPELSADRDRLARFQREAEAVAALNHANIVTLYSVEESTGGLRFLTMELVEGHTLDTLVPAGGLALDTLLTLAVPLASAVSAAHEKGITHRDLKPANVMVTPQGEVKILDFGLAKLQSSTDAELDTRTTDFLTSGGAVIGTVGYMSPEQAEGKPLDHRTDIFSLGVLLYEMATGRRPFTGDSAAAVMSSILRDPSPDVHELRPELPRQLSRIVNHCLAKSPDERLQTAKDVLNLLTALRNEESGAPMSTGHRTDRPRRRLVAVGVAAAVAAVVGLFALNMVNSITSRAPAPPVALQRIAVLPSIYLGPPEREYFAAALTEELISRLVSVEGIAVPSRVHLDPPARMGRTLGQVGEELGVDYILEAAVQWQEGEDGDSRVRITPQLIDVDNDLTLWSQRYEHDTAGGNLFEVQSDIAERVLDQIGITLQASPLISAEGRGTDTPAAYDAYMRGSELLVRADEFYQREPANAAIELFEEAIALDPSFALAHARLAMAHAFLFNFYFDRSDTRRELSREAAEQALTLAPSLPEGRLALGQYYRAGLEYDLALREYEVAVQGRPGDSLVVQAIAEVNWYMGNADDSIDAYQRASHIDPQRSVLLCNMGGAYRMKGEHAAAVTVHDQAVAMRPRRVCPYFCLVFTQLHWGKPEAARAVVDRIPEGVSLEVTPPINYPLFLLDLIEGEYEQALTRLTAGSADAYDWQHFWYPKALLRGQVYRFMDRPEDAERSFLEAVEILEQQLETRPGDSRYYSSLGLAYAGLGRTQDAIDAGRLGVELLPYSKDRFAGPYRLRDLAQIYAIVGDHDEAIENLRILTSLDSLIHLPEIAGDPTWSPLRGDPRFQALVAG